MENVIGYHCAPALAGIKASNIVACYKDKGYNVNREISRLNNELNSRKIYLEPLCESEKRVLVMVYRSNVLCKALKNEEVKSFLSSLGYPADADLHTYIRILKKRLINEDFPHEIGAFLGYPMHDVYGFINHRDEECLLCGEWKVYKKPEEAQKMFERFSACRKALAGQIMKGHSLSQMFCIQNTNI